MRCEVVSGRWIVKLANGRKARVARFHFLLRIIALLIWGNPCLVQKWMGAKIVLLTIRLDTTGGLQSAWKTHGG